MTRSIENEYRAVIESRTAVDPKHKILIKGGTIISMDANVGDFVKGDLLVEGTKIVEIGQNLYSPDAEVIDASGMIAHANGIIGSDFEKQIVEKTPLGRIGQPEDIASLAMFLASANSGWLTGETLSASAGMN